MPKMPKFQSKIHSSYQEQERSQTESKRQSIDANTDIKGTWELSGKFTSKQSSPKCFTEQLQTHLKQMTK